MADPVSWGVVAGAVSAGATAYSAHEQSKAAKAKPPASGLAPTPTMPVPDDQAIQQARRRSIVGQLARRGRASTILTEPTEEKLGV